MSISGILSKTNFMSLGAQPVVLSKNTPDPVEVHLYRNISKVPEEEWDKCVNADHIFLNRRYLGVCESSSLPGMSFRYAILYTKGVPSAVLYFQLVNLSDSGLGGILNLDDYGGLAASVSNKINDLLFSPGGDKHSYLLVCGNLLLSGEHGISAIDKNSYKAAVESIPELKRNIQNALQNNEKVVAYMVKDFYDEKNKIAAPLLKKEYFSLNTDPEMIFDVNKEWNNFEDYLSALSSKYRIRANNARKKLLPVTYRTLTLEELIKYKHEIFDLSEQVMRKAPVKLAKPSLDYFINLKKAFGDNYHLKGFFLDDKIIGFSSGLFNASHYEAHYIGINYQFNRSHAVYQNLLYSFIEDAITSKSKTLFFGRTALEIKSTTGAKPHHLACYFKFANRILNTLAKPMISSAGPREWIPRDPFKQE